MPFWKKPSIENVLVDELYQLRNIIKEGFKNMASTIQEALTDLTNAVNNNTTEISKAVEVLKNNPGDTVAIAAIEQAVDSLNQSTANLASADGTTPASTPSV